MIYVNEKSSTEKLLDLIETVEEEDDNILDITEDNDDEAENVAPEDESVDIELEESVDIEIEEEVDFILEEDPKSVITTYSENHFLEAVLDPMGKEITDKIIDMKLNNECNIASMVQVMEAISTSNFTNSTKDYLVKNLIETYTNINSEVSSFDESFALLEFSGDPQKNKEFIKILDLLEKFVNDLIEVDLTMYKVGDKLLEILEGVNKPNADAHKIVNDCRLEFDNFTQWYSKKLKADLNPGLDNFQKFYKTRNKFNSKYSTEIMESKKVLDEKLDKAFSTVYNNKDLCQWINIEDSDCAKFNKMCDLWDKLKQLDIDEAGKCAQYCLNPFYSGYLANISIYTIRIIQSIRYYLDIEKENSISYKLIQKIFKDKDATKKPDTKSQAKTFSAKALKLEVRNQTTI